MRKIFFQGLSNLFEQLKIKVETGIDRIGNNIYYISYLPNIYIIISIY